MDPLPHAIDRRQLRITIPTSDGAATYETLVFPLWHETEHAPGVPHDRPDVWRVLFRDVGDPMSWRPGHIHADDCAIVAVSPDQVAPNIAAGNLPGSLPRAEMLCVFARFGVRIRFAYDKGQGIFESRHGLPLGFKAGKDGMLLVLEDADRDNAKRSFKLSSMSGILATGSIPTWEPGVGWMAPKPVQADDRGEP